MRNSLRFRVMAFGARRGTHWSWAPVTHFVGPTVCRCAASAPSPYPKSLISAQILPTPIDPPSSANPSRRVSGSALGTTFRPAREHSEVDILGSLAAPTKHPWAYAMDGG